LALTSLNYLALLNESRAVFLESGSPVSF